MSCRCIFGADADNASRRLQLIEKHGCDSLLSLLAMSDARLKLAGVTALGHRRQLQRELRQDERVQGLAMAARQAAQDANGERRRGLHAAREGSAAGRGAPGSHASVSGLYCSTLLSS